MTHKVDEEIQQQVLFEESDLVNSTTEQGDASEVTEQVIVNNAAYIPEVDTTLESLSEKDSMNLQQGVIAQGKRKKVSLWTISLLIFLVLLVIETVEFFQAGLNTSPWVTSLYGVLLILIVVITGHSVWREFSSLRQLKARDKIQSQAINIIHHKEDNNHQDIEQTKVFCHNINESLPCELIFADAEDQRLWEAALTAEHNSAELMQLYSRLILSKVDDKALNEVAKFSTEAVVFIALSPAALLDMLIMLSRNLRMINKIAGLYGLKLGYWSRIKLIKQVIINMAYAGASELAADFGTDMLGAELVGKLSTRFAQGLGAGMLTARLGAKTMELCRPIPFEERPKLNHVRQKVVLQVKELMFSKTK